jgi:hypothetical protein
MKASSEPTWISAATIGANRRRGTRRNSDFDDQRRGLDQSFDQAHDEGTGSQRSQHRTESEAFSRFSGPF